jgi:hypothetical protein
LFTKKVGWCIGGKKKEIQFRTAKLKDASPTILPGSADSGRAGRSCVFLGRFFRPGTGLTVEETVMGAMKENPRYNVVSIRVSDEELEALQEFCKESNKSVSIIMREAMSLIRTDAQKAGNLLYDGLPARM